MSKVILAALGAATMLSSIPATAKESAKASVVAASPINETTWEFTQGGKPMQEFVDSNGNYITTSGTEDVDHGTVVMKHRKACFTSAMTKKPACWSDPKLEVGASGQSTSDKGEKLSLKRVAYVSKSM